MIKSKKDHFQKKKINITTQISIKLETDPINPSGLQQKILVIKFHALKPSL